MCVLIERSAARTAFGNWHSLQGAPRIFLLLGSPGSGKTTFCETLVATGEPEISAAHFCRANDASSTSPRAVLVSLARGIARIDPAFAEELVSNPIGAATLQIEINANYVPGKIVGAEIGALHLDGMTLRDMIWLLLIKPFQSLQRRDLTTPRTLLIDGLDEAGDEAQQLGSSLGQLGGLPAWVRIVASSRPNGEVIRSISARDTFRFSLDDDYPPELLRSEVAELISRHFRDTPGADPKAEVVLRLAERAAGNFQFADMLARLATQDPGAWDERILPRDLIDLYGTYLQRLAPTVDRWRQFLRPLLALLSVALEPISESQLRLYGGLPITAARDGLDMLSAFLRISGEAKTPTFAIYHASFSEFLRSNEAGIYWCPPVEAHGKMVETLGWPISVNWTSADDYLLRQGLIHLMAAGTPTELLDDAIGETFYTRKHLASPMGSVVEDFRRYAKSLLGGDRTALLWRVCWMTAVAREASRVGTATLAAAYVKTGRWRRAVELANALDVQSAQYASERSTVLGEIVAELAGIGDLDAAHEVMALLDGSALSSAAMAAAERRAEHAPTDALGLLHAGGLLYASAAVCAGLARHKDFRLEATELAGDSTDALWAVALELWPDDPEAAEKLVRHKSLTQAPAGIKHERTADDLPLMALVKLAAGDPRRAADLLEQRNPIRLGRRYDLLMIVASRIFSVAPERAVAMLECDLDPHEEAMAKALLCAAGGAGRYPQLAALSDETIKWGDTIVQLQGEPSALEIAAQIDLAELSRNPTARRFSRWCLNATVTWVQSLERLSDRVDYPSVLIPLLTRWFGVLDPDAGIKFVEWLDGDHHSRINEGRAGLLRGVVEADGWERALALVQRYPSLFTEDALRAATGVIAQREPGHVLDFIQSVVSKVDAQIPLRGVAARMLSARRQAELEALLVGLPAFGASELYRTTRAIVRAAVVIETGPDGQLALEEIIADEWLPHDLRVFSQFTALVGTDPAAAGALAMTMESDPWRAELLRQTAAATGDPVWLARAAATADAVDFGSFLPGVGLIDIRDVRLAVAIDLLQHDFDAATGIAVRHADDPRILSSIVAARLNAEPNIDPIALTLEMLAMRSPRGDSFADSMAGWRALREVVVTIAKRTQRLEELLSWLELYNPDLADFVRLQTSTEHPEYLVEALVDRLRPDGAWERAQARHAIRICLIRLAGVDLPAAMRFWRQHPEDEDAFVDIIKAAATAGNRFDRGSLTALLDGHSSKEYLVNLTMSRLSAVRGALDWREGLALVNEIRDWSLRKIGLEALIKARRSVQNRQPDELQSLLDAAEALEDEQQRLEVIGDLLEDPGAAWTLDLAELSLVRCINASRDRWYRTLPSLARRLAAANPSFAGSLCREFSITDQVASVTIN